MIIYDDRAAGNRAVRTLSALKAPAAPDANLSPIPWSFDLLTELAWRSRATRDIDTADLLILSLSKPDDIPSAIHHWINSCLHRERTAFIPVLLQFGDHDLWTIELTKVSSAPSPVTPSTAPAPHSGTLRQRHPARFPIVRPTARRSTVHA